MIESWSVVTVDAVESVGFYGSLAVDGSGRLHLSYWDFTNRDLKYATCAAACAIAANWQTVTVDAAGDVGEYTSLAVDGTGHAHVSYYDNSNDDLKYATCAADCAAAASWQTATVDAGGNVGRYTSLAVGAGERLHVSYYDDSNLDLKYATCAGACTTGATWQAATVDAAGNVGRDNSLGVDANGRLHISYFDESSFDLRYATCAAACTTPANWQATTVDAAGVVGTYTSLAVDANGRVHVSYVNGSSLDLKYIE